MISLIRTTGHADIDSLYVVRSRFNSIVVPTFQTKIILPGFRVDFNCPNDGSKKATATVR
jgi:hypothetical protein